MIKIFKPKNWAFFEFSGPDALDFLHRLTTINLRKLSAGEGASGFVLNPQGKILTYLHLWQVSKNQYLIEIDSGEGEKWKKKWVQTIEAFTFNDNVKMREISGYEPLWVFSDTWEQMNSLFSINLLDRNPEVMASLAVEGRFYSIQKNLSAMDGLVPNPGEDSLAAAYVFNHGKLDYGKTWISIWGKVIFPESFEILEELTLEAWRIEQVRPRVDFEISLESSPLELGLIDGISQGKGCYPGQEVIEKILALGAPAQRLVQVRGAGGLVPKIGQPLLKKTENSFLEIGRITSGSVQIANDFVALAIVKKTVAKVEMPLFFQNDEREMSAEVIISKVSGFK